MNYMEVLLSLFILSCAILGINAMQLLALRETQAIDYFNVARYQIQSIKERLQLIKNGNTSLTISAWNKQNQSLLPKGRGSVTGHFPNMIITIFWGLPPNAICRKTHIGLSGCLTYSAI